MAIFNSYVKLPEGTHAKLLEHVQLWMKCSNSTRVNCGWIRSKTTHWNATQTTVGETHQKDVAKSTASTHMDQYLWKYHF